ncbi:MAG TPA: hotdog domain-containing protein [Longimicrobiaceae bacterium]|nr:hotdog domain-containing protein [Longimicrobiaceae bacterium]
MDVIAGTPLGVSASRSVTVTRELTVAHFHAGSPEVYGTPMMIYLMEVAAAAAIQPHLPAGWVSVGTEVEVEHLAATPVGLVVTATATLIGRTEKTLVFEVEAHDGLERIGVGRHVRAPVERARFEHRVAAKAARANAAE